MAQSKLLSPREASAPRAALCRLKAIASEQRAKDAADPALRQDWEELAIEWHLLASLAATPAPLQRTDAHDLSHYVESLDGTIHRIAQRG